VGVSGSSDGTLTITKIPIKTTNSKVDAFLRNAQKWREEFRELRRMLLECGLSEELKWGKPAYTLEDKNIVLIQGFKEYCALLFFKGALLKDANHILTKMGENTQAARQVRFRSLREIAELKPILKNYVKEAIGVEKAGLKVEFKKASEFAIPEEFQKKLNATAALKAAFKSLTPGRQRGYLIYFSKPKQSQTRESRIEKCAPQILKGKGLND
jgi:uncharacterized protein YdeI (YjbR/CyaY-like superfamily)